MNERIIVLLRIIKNKSAFSGSELVKMVRRENNSKRNYLLVNSVQGKHIPADPSRVLELFRQLAEEVKIHINSEKTVFIGFAETATAVGAGVASHFKNSYYVHTTRETGTEGEPVAEFREEHSHAAEQLLYCNRWDEIISDARHIVFVEDEISTGNTIMNFVNVLRNEKKVPADIKFSACSVLNGMSAEREAELKNEGVVFYYLLKHAAEPDSDEIYSFVPDNPERTSDYLLSEKILGGYINPRTGSDISLYADCCAELAERTAALCETAGKSVAVIGTEECMYPAVCTAEAVKKKGAAHVVTHSTTRSPIVADRSPEYPLKSRYAVESFYEKERKTFIYNSDINSYDIVIVVTDSDKKDYDFISLAEAFCKSERFMLVRWVK